MNTLKTVLAALILASVAYGQTGHGWDQYGGIEFHVKKHTTNTVTAEIDTFWYNMKYDFVANDLSAADTLWQVDDQDTDTSRVYVSYGITSLYHDVIENTGSADYTINIYTAWRDLYVRGRNRESYSRDVPPPFASGMYKLAATKTVTADGVWNLGSLPPNRWYYITVTGNAGNGSDIDLILKAACTEDDPRRR